MKKWMYRPYVLGFFNGMTLMLSLTSIAISTLTILQHHGH